jgi:hypothetical protein
MINDQGGQIRILCRDMEILMRRHQLHEVISFMNLVVNDLDMPQ